MSIYPNVTEQDFFILRKLAEQQKNLRAPTSKIRILKQTHDTKLAESLSPVTKKLEEVKKSTQNSGDVLKEKNTPQLALEKTRKKLPTENEPIHPGILYDTILKTTLSNLKKKTERIF